VGRARIAALILVAAQALGCAGQQGSPSQPASQSPPPTPTSLVGAPLQAGPPPSSETCREELIGDLAAAKRIRTDLRIPGIAPTDAAIAAAANDPTADTSTAGIPLTHSELGALAASGLAMDGGNPLSEWVQVGEPGRFGGIWISPPGSGRYVVSILASDPDALGLAQCVGKGVDIRFVVADTTVADLKALVDRISDDIDTLRASGISIASAGIGLQGSVMVVVVGVTGLTDQIRTTLVARYGSKIVIKEEAPAQPL